MVTAGSADEALGELTKGRPDLLICDELGYVSMSRGGVELLFRVFADRYERGSLLDALAAAGVSPEQLIGAIFNLPMGGEPGGAG